MHSSVKAVAQERMAPEHQRQGNCEAASWLRCSSVGVRA
jgi:hypothetical protein